MQYPAIALGALLIGALPASARSGFFLGGAADGAAHAEELDLQRRAIELDSRDGGSRYDRLRREQQLDELNQQLKKNNDLLDQIRMQRSIQTR